MKPSESAAHEAGHAIACVAYGVEMESVEVFPDESKRVGVSRIGRLSGRCRSYPAGHDFDAEDKVLWALTGGAIQDSPDVRARIATIQVNAIVNAIVLYAGPLAESASDDPSGLHVFGNDIPNLAFTEDLEPWIDEEDPETGQQLQDNTKAAEWIGLLPGDRERWAWIVQIATVRFLGLPEVWAAHQRLAFALDDGRRLSGEDCARIIGAHVAGSRADRFAAHPELCGAWGSHVAWDKWSRAKAHRLRPNVPTLTLCGRPGLSLHWTPDDVHGRCAACERLSAAEQFVSREMDGSALPVASAHATARAAASADTAN